MSMSPAVQNRFDAGITAASRIAPIAPLVFMMSYAWDRSRAAASDAARDDGGFSLTIQEIFWAAIAVSVVAGVGFVIFNAVSDRGTDIGDDITNRPLP